MTKEEQKRDRYYLKKYGVGLDWYEARRKEQNYCCGICKRPERVFKRRLSIDHDHSHSRVKIKTVKDPVHGWWIRAHYLGGEYTDVGRPKLIMIRAMKAAFKTLSARGLLCNFCNRGLRYYQDIPERFTAAAEYLRKHQKG